MFRYLLFAGGLSAVLPMPALGNLTVSSAATAQLCRDPQRRSDRARNLRRNTRHRRSGQERGLDAPLEEIARRAEVSIGTLYNHFPTREDFFDAIFPQRLVVLDEIAATALADPDPWQGFVTFVEELFALQAEDCGLNEALAQRVAATTAMSEACHRAFQHLDRIIARAGESGQLRADFQTEDMTTLMWAMFQVIRGSMGTVPHVWQRFLAFFLDGLRADAATPSSFRR